MSTEAKNITCPNCGAPQPMDATTCKYCKSPVIISTYTSVAEMPMPLLNKYVNSYKKELAQDGGNIAAHESIAFCYFKLKLYDKAIESFSKAIEEVFDNSDLYFYLAICLLKGKKAFLTPRPVIDQIEEYIQAALSIENKGIYYYFWAYIRYDHHHRKFYNMNPNYQQIYQMAKDAGLSEYDVAELYKILGVERPSCL